MQRAIEAIGKGPDDLPGARAFEKPERLEAHYQERERVLEQNLRGLRAQVETLARQVNACSNI